MLTYNQLIHHPFSFQSIVATCAALLDLDNGASSLRPKLDDFEQSGKSDSIEFIVGRLQSGDKGT